MNHRLRFRTATLKCLRWLHRRSRNAINLYLVTPEPCPPQAAASPTPAKILLTHPLTIYTLNSVQQPLGAASALGPRMADRPMLFLIGFTWQIENRNRAKLLARQKRLYERRYRRHRIVLLGNSRADAASMSEFTDSVHLLNHNTFVDEDVFRPLLDMEKRYDAVYVARMTPWKRHELVSGVSSAVHVFERELQLGWDASLAYLNRMKSEMPSHHFVNRIGTEAFERLPPHEVNRVLNSAHVGLCLSAEEGAMFASMEYLLAGLPIVSTPSLGGRDYFFDPDYCLIVPPDPSAIRDAVEALKARRIPAAAIRERTLEKVKRERRRFFDILCGAARELAAEPGPQIDWNDPRLKGMCAWQPLSQVEHEIQVALSAGESLAGG
jgi:glycosyltransferase involved in cell wall biosynthesis